MFDIIKSCFLSKIMYDIQKNDLTGNKNMAKPRVKTILKFIGGINKDRIGGNCSVLEHTDETGKTERVMFDLGSMFTPYESGFTAAYPNVDEYFDRTDLKTGKIYKALKPVNTLFITHAHEDHIGALINYTKMGYTLPPIKAGAFTRNFIRLAFAAEGMIAPEMEKIKAGDIIRVGDNIEVEAVDVSHSIVASLGFYTLTYNKGKPYAAIMNNGDFLTEEEMPFGKAFNKARYLDTLKRKKVPTTVLCLDSTSTTPQSSERIGFDKAVENTYNAVMTHADRNLIISPVISRSVQNIAIDVETARRLGTKIFLDGKWLQTVKNAMALSGYENFDDVIYKGTIQGYLNDKRLTKKYIVCTGAFAQGLENYEYNVGIDDTSPIPMSSATKMALDLHPYVKIDKNVLILARQRIIEEINGRTGPKMLQLFASQGAAVVMTPGNRPVGGFEEVRMQDSGHANANAVKALMIDVKKAVPDVIVIPIHGNPEQCRNTEEIMSGIGVKTYVAGNQEGLEISHGKVINVEPKVTPMTWYAVKSVMPNPFAEREIPLEGMKEYWEVTEDYHPLQKICEVQNTTKSKERGKYNNHEKKISQAEEMPYREQMRKTSLKTKNKKIKTAYDLRKKMDKRNR